MAAAHLLAKNGLELGQECVGKVRCGHPLVLGLSVPTGEGRAREDGGEGRRATHLEVLYEAGLANAARVVVPVDRGDVVAEVVGVALQGPAVRRPQRRQRAAAGCQLTWISAMADCTERTAMVSSSLPSTCFWILFLGKVRARAGPRGGVSDRTRCGPRTSAVPQRRGPCPRRHRALATRAPVHSAGDDATERLAKHGRQ